MGTVASQITSLTIIYSTVYSDTDKKTSKLHVTGLCAGNSPGTGNAASDVIIIHVTIPGTLEGLCDTAISCAPNVNYEFIVFRGRSRMLIKIVKRAQEE